MRVSLVSMCVALAMVSYSCGNDGAGLSVPSPMRYDEFTVNGELRYRIEQNFERLNSDKYQPGNVFLTEEESGGWPGDTEGRTILGLVCDASAAHKPIGQLAGIIAGIPAHLNSLGYMGPEYGDRMNEQQLSGNGWMLRGLCAYYEMSSDKKALDWIRSISENLFVKGKGLYKTYPIDPALRVSGEGGESGNIRDTSGRWMLSTDTGCLFIGMDGLIDAYRLVGTPEMKEVIEEMLERFLEMDLVGTQAQTHASLTACRGLVRYAEITGDNRWLLEAEKRWQIYKEYGMTENYANYNWFCRYDTWTEPCAIVDSYILALKLWQHTGNIGYLRDAQLIYYNALCHTQRANGGFGCDSCPGDASGPEITVRIDEAHWCCTMRGAEGLATAAAYTFMKEGNTFYITNFRSMVMSAEGVEIEMNTEYPYEGLVVLNVNRNDLGSKLKLKLYVPDWMNLGTLERGEERTDAKVGKDGFLTIGNISEGEHIIVNYTYTLRQEKTLNPRNTRPGQVRYFNGPLILQEEGLPIFHIMDPKVCKDSSYHHQIVFNGL